MPIKFRCNSCRQKLSISRKKAGREVNCPQCAERILVPTEEQILAAMKAAQAKKNPEPSEPTKNEDAAPAPPKAEPPVQKPPTGDPPQEQTKPSSTPASEAPESLPDVPLDESFFVPPADIQPPSIGTSKSGAADEEPAISDAPSANIPRADLPSEARAAAEKEARENAPSHAETTEMATPSSASSSDPLATPEPATTSKKDDSAETNSNWDHHPNPWLHEEDEEDDFSLGTGELEESGLDMTPMVDVTFLLLIFFMVTASFTTQKSLETSPPEPDEEGAAQSVTMEDLEEESVIVEIDGEDNIRVDDVPISGINALVSALEGKISENKTEMLIEADENARHGTVVAVTDAGIEAQMQRIRRTSKKSDD